MAYAPAILPDTLLINGVDLQSLPLIVADFAGLHAPGTKRGANIVVPGVAGEIGTAKVYDAYTFDVPVTIVPDYADGSTPLTSFDRRAQYLANLAKVQTAIDVGLTTFTRKLAAVGGGTTSMTCNGEYIAGLAVTMLNHNSGKTILQFRNLDGAWTDGVGGIHL